MKKIGIVGGLAWPSTVEYYSGLCRRAEQWHVQHHLSPQVPEIVIESLSLTKAFSLIGSNDDESSWAGFDQYHRAALERLQQSGADFALIAANTPHHRFDTITAGLRIPVVSIIDATAKACTQLGLQHLLLLGTAVTMASGRFREAFRQSGIEAIAPADEGARRKVIDLINDLQQGRDEGSASRLSQLAKQQLQACFHGQRAAVSLACTELPLAFRSMEAQTSFEYDGVVYVNTTLAHIEAVFARAITE